MLISYFHDVKIVDYKDKFYTFDGLNEDIIKERYLKFCNTFNMVTRIVRDDSIDEKKVAVFNDKRITFNGVRTASLLKVMISPKVKKIIKENVLKSNLCIIRLPGTIGNIAYKYARKYNKKYIVEVVGCPFDAFWNHQRKIGKIIGPLMFIKTRFNIKRAENVIYVTNEFLQKRYPNNCNNIGCSDVLINPIDDEKLKLRLDKIDKKTENKFVFGMIGSLDVSYKGQATAIEAMSLLKDKIDFELHFLGAGDKTQWVEYAKKYGIEEKMIFDGTLPGGEKVYEWMDGLDIFLIPSYLEGMPRALIEAMSRACPAIGTAVGGIPEILDVTFRKKDSKELADKILELVSSKENMKQCALRNLEVAKGFDKEVLRKRRENFIRKCLEE